MLARTLARNLLSLIVAGGAAFAAQTPHWTSTPVATPRAALSRLTPAERATAIRLIRPDLGPLFQGESNATADQAILSFTADRIRLGSMPALVVQPSGGDLCSSTGNCALWIIDLAHRRIILKRGAVQGFGVVKTSGEAMPKIITSMHGSALDTERILWRFNGSRYEAETCADIEYDENATNAPPAIKPYPCSAEGNRQE